MILVAHPKIAASATQQFLKASADLPAVNWHHLDNLEKFDVEKERQLLLAADRIILQFPLYWYNVPASLNNWLAETLSTAFLHGNGHSVLAGKTIGVVVNTGLPAKAFQAGGQVGFTMDSLLTPLRALSQDAELKWLPIFQINQFENCSETQRQQLLVDYQRYLTQEDPTSFAAEVDWFERGLAKLSAGLPVKQQAQAELILATLREQQANYLELTDAVRMMKEGTDDLE